MASLSSKRKMIANRQLQQRGSAAKRDAKAQATARPSAGKPLVMAVPAPVAFSEERYGQIRSRYQDLVGDAGDMADVRQLMRTIVQHEFDAGGREAALEMRPYILKYVNEQRRSASALR